MERRCPVRSGDCVLRPDVLGEFLFELGHEFSSGRDPAGFDALGHILEFVAPHVGLIERDEIWASLLACGETGDAEVIGEVDD